jgi:hypothetical protein
MSKQIFRVPQFLSAPSPESLVIACLNHQRLNDTMYEYQIVFTGKKWFAWYHSDATKTMRGKK